MNKPTLIMLVGLPGSGKSTYAKTVLSHCKIHSSDDLREELYGDVNNQSSNDKLFRELHKRIKEDLRAGNDVVYDATNIHWKRRKAFLKEISNIDCYTEAHLIATPYEVCVVQNLQRFRMVPESVIERMYKHFDVPFYNEGWDDIFIVYGDEKYDTAYGEVSQFIYDTLDFDQDNRHHKLKLGKHCLECSNYITNNLMTENPSDEDYPWETIMAGMLHDCGKPFTQTKMKPNGTQSDQSHYYHHENVGSYNSLFYKCPEKSDIDKLYMAALIRWHMLPHLWSDWSEKTQTKYIDEFTNDNMKTNANRFWDNLMLLHQGDLNAH
jgi:predicted kinase